MDTTPHTRSGRAGATGAVPTPGRARPAERPHALTIEGLRCRYGGFEAVRRVDLTVRRGELFALLGTNGAGKTTTLETLEGHRAPDAGHIEVLGCHPHRERARLAARTGVVLQHSGLPDELTPHEALELWTRLTPDAPGHLDPDDALGRVDLDHRAGVRLRQLSGGERRRLDLALAIVSRPELVFLDEPTTGMDPQARVRTWRILRDLVGEGVTVVLTTHYLEEAEALADRLAIMHEGRLAVTGTVAELVAAHPSRVAARLPQHAPALPPMSGQVRADRSGRLTVSTHRLQEDLTRLCSWAEAHGVVLADLEAAEASLAEVFHGIAGARPVGDGPTRGEDS